MIFYTKGQSDVAKMTGAGFEKIEVSVYFFEGQRKQEDISGAEVLCLFKRETSQGASEMSSLLNRSGVFWASTGAWSASNKVDE